MLGIHDDSVRSVGRFFFGGATLAFGAAGLLVRDASGLWVAAGACGTVWLVWDVVMDHVLVPLGEWLVHLFVAGAPGVSASLPRPTLEDTVRLLESHLENRASRRVQINAAIRLEEIYRVVKKDPRRARDVIARVRDRFPDAPEFTRYDP